MKILHGRQGYTLIEMTIVLFIILAFLAMSVPFFSNFSSSTGLKTVEREAVTLLRTARSYAVAQNVNIKTEFNAGVTPNTYRITDAAGVTLQNTKTYQLPTGVNFTAPITTVTFTANGGLANGSGSSVTVVETKNATKSKTITVDSVTGAVTMQ